MDVNKYIGERIRYFRKRKNITMQEMAEDLNLTQQAISRYERGDRKTNQDILFILADYFKVSINDFFPPQNFNNAEVIPETIKIAIYGSIKAGIPLESQNDIIEEMEIPSYWAKGGKKLFGLKISGDSMFPKYQDGEIVIFEQTNDIEAYKNKDCAIMINHCESTFKKIQVNEKGIVLQPYNASYDIQIYTNEDIKKLPIIVLGKAIKKVSDID